MRHIFLIILTITSLLSKANNSVSLDDYSSFFSKSSKIYDYTGKIDSQTIYELNWTVDSIQEQLSIDIEIIFIDSLNGFGINELATNIANNHKIGSLTDFGLLILISDIEREVFIATDKVTTRNLSNPQIQLIVDNYLLPPLREGDYLTGVRTSLQQIATPLHQLNEDPVGVFIYIVIGIIFVAFIAFIIYDYNKLGGFSKNRFKNNISGRPFLWESNSVGEFSDSGGGFDGGGAGGSFGGDGGGDSGGD